MDAPYAFSPNTKIYKSMKNNNTDNKYQEGLEVYAMNKPSEKLVIRRYVDRIYYCLIANHPDQKELAFFERELTSKAGTSKVL
jgi:hypothetical protein